MVKKCIFSKFKIKMKKAHGWTQNMMHAWKSKKKLIKHNNYSLFIVFEHWMLRNKQLFVQLLFTGLYSQIQRRILHKNHISIKQTYYTIWKRKLHFKIKHFIFPLWCPPYCPPYCDPPDCETLMWSFITSRIIAHNAFWSEL